MMSELYIGERKTVIISRNVEIDQSDKHVLDGAVSILVFSSAH